MIRLSIYFFVAFFMFANCKHIDNNKIIINTFILQFTTINILLVALLIFECFNRMSFQYNIHRYH